MKTIEERARAYAEQFREYHQLAMFKAYLDGADSQKAIDDAGLAEVKRQRDEYYDELLKLRRQKVKGLEWLKVNYGHFDGSIEDLVADFRKAMEE